MRLVRFEGDLWLLRLVQHRGPGHVKLPQMSWRNGVRCEQSQQFVVDPKPHEARHILPVLQVVGVALVTRLNHFEQPLRNKGGSDPLPGRGVHVPPVREHLGGGPPGAGMEGLFDRSPCRGQPDTVVIGQSPGPLDQGVDHLLSLVSVGHTHFRTFACAP